MAPKSVHQLAKALACAFCVRGEASLLLRSRPLRHYFLLRDQPRPHHLMRCHKTVAHQTHLQNAHHDCYLFDPAALTRRSPKPKCGDTTLATYCQ